MGESARVAPEPAASKSSLSPMARGVLVAATLLSGVAGASCFLPWFTESRFEDSESRMGLTFIEGIVEFALAIVCFFLFLAVLIKRDPRGRARLAAVATFLAFGMAIAPLELFARGAYIGFRSTVVLGVGYTGWSYGLYLALVAGFVAAAMGGLGAGKVSVRKAAAPVKLQSLRKAPRA